MNAYEFKVLESMMPNDDWVRSLYKDPLIPAKAIEAVKAAGLNPSEDLEKLNRIVSQLTFSNLQMAFQTSFPTPVGAPCGLEILEQHAGLPGANLGTLWRAVVASENATCSQETRRVADLRLKEIRQKQQERVRNQVLARFGYKIPDRDATYFAVLTVFAEFNGGPLTVRAFTTRYQPEISRRNANSGQKAISKAFNELVQDGNLRLKHPDHPRKGYRLTDDGRRVYDCWKHSAN